MTTTQTAIHKHQWLSPHGWSRDCECGLTSADYIAQLEADNGALLEERDRLRAAIEELLAVQFKPADVAYGEGYFDTHDGKWESNEQRDLVLGWDKRKREARKVARAALSGPATKDANDA